MRRFQPTPRPITLHDKALNAIDDQRFMPPSAERVELRIARVLGMDTETRAALATLLSLSKEGRTGVVGRFFPDSSASDLLASEGITEHVPEGDFSRFTNLVIPYAGIPLKRRQAWEKAGHRFKDLTSARVRRAQISLGLLRAEGARALVIGRHDDPESLTLTGAGSIASVIEDTTDTARLEFAPSYGVIAQTNLSPRRVSWLEQQLRHRYRDSRVTFLDTVSPAMAAREEALERFLVDCTLAVIVGDAGESSCEALAETVLRRGKQPLIVSSPNELTPENLAGHRKIVLTAGNFAMDARIHSVAEILSRKPPLAS